MLSAVLALFVYGTIAALLGTILPDFSKRFQFTPRQNGAIAAAQAWGLVIASLGAGPFIDTYGKKAGLVIGLAMVAAVLFALPRSKTFSTVLVLLFLMGLGGGTIVTCGNALASDVGEAHRAMALNAANVAFGIGALITPLLFANLLRGNIRRLAYGIAVLTTGVLVLQILTRIPAPLGTHSLVFSEIPPVLGRPVLFLLGLVLFLYISCEVGVWNWLTQHLIAQGIEPATALNILSLGFALGMLLGRAAAAPILLRVAPLTLTVTCSILMALTTLFLLRARTARQAWVFVFLAGLSMAPVFPTTLAIVANASPRMTGTAMGFAITSGWLGLAVSSRIIGAIAGGDTSRLRKALLVLPAFSGIMLVLNLTVGLLLH